MLTANIAVNPTDICCVYIASRSLCTMLDDNDMNISFESLPPVVSSAATDRVSPERTWGRTEDHCDEENNDIDEISVTLSANVSSRGSKSSLKSVNKQVKTSSKKQLDGINQGLLNLLLATVAITILYYNSIIFL